ncbi:hypothetical protein GGI43DRAFT_378034 [Trichoderma evansii]
MNSYNRQVKAVRYEFKDATNPRQPPQPVDESVAGTTGVAEPAMATIASVAEPAIQTTMPDAKQMTHAPQVKKSAKKRRNRRSKPTKRSQQTKNMASPSGIANAERKVNLDIKAAVSTTVRGIREYVTQPLSSVAHGIAQLLVKGHLLSQGNLIPNLSYPGGRSCLDMSFLMLYRPEIFFFSSLTSLFYFGLVCFVKK